MAAPQIRQNFHKRKVSMRPMVSAELKPMCLSDGRTGGGMAAGCSGTPPTAAAAGLGWRAISGTTGNKHCWLRYTLNRLQQEMGNTVNT